MDYFFKCLKREAPGFFFSFLFLLIIGVGGVSSLKAQSLSPGDIVLVTVNSDGDGNFDFVPLVDLPSGTVIKFTDDAWDPNASQFRGSEGIITYTAPTSISAGTVVSYSGSDGNGFERTSGNFSIANGGDNIIVYQGSESSPNLLYGAGFARGNSVWDYDDDTNSSGIPSNLSEADNTILNLGTDDNYQYDTSNGTEGTQTTLKDLIGDEGNWKEDDENAFSALNASFSLVAPPTLAFTTNSLSVDEDGTSIDLTIELVEDNNSNVTVDVVFLSGSSEADGSDINYSTQTVSFAPSNSSGDTESVTVNIVDDSDVENNEIAAFQLQNNSEGTINEPDILNLTIDDNDATIIINEFLADPPTGTAGDANGDGTRDGIDDEFIELVNNSSVDINISGWQLSDDGGSTIRHTFTSGTVLPANQAIVVFGGGEPSGSFGGAIVQTSSGLSLNNGGDDLTLLDDQGTVIQSEHYDGSIDQQSITRTPDISGSLEGHTIADTDDNSNFSPGTKVDGTAFGSTYAIAFRGTEGWRFVSTPSINTSFNDLFADLWTQGVAGSDAPSGDPNLYSWQEGSGGTFSDVDNMSNNLAAGQGYIVYVFEDDNYSAPGVQGGFPKIINTSNEENESQINVAVSSNDEDGSGSIDGEEGYNLLGNPFGTDISVDAVITALESVNSNVNANVYIWDDDLEEGDGDYEILAEGSGEIIAPFQAFFVRYTENGISGDVTFNRSDLAANQGTRFYKQSGSEPVNFELRLGNEHKFDTYEVVFDKRGTIGEDRFDAYKLFSLNANAIQLFSLVGEEIRLARNILPALEDLESELRIPVGYDVSESGQYTFGWTELDDIPRRYELHLVDNETGRKINMRNTTDYSFNLTVQGKTPKRNRSKISPSIDRDINQANESRFELVIAGSAPVDEDNEEMDQMVTLSPNYPNPFRAGVETRMDMQLRENVHVKVTIWNIVGQKVATLRDEMMPAGDASLSWSAPANMPSGIYICKVEAGDKVITRKMTLVK